MFHEEKTPGDLMICAHFCVNSYKAQDFIVS